MTTSSASVSTETTKEDRNPGAMSFLDSVMAVDLSVAKTAFKARPIQTGDHLVGVMSDHLIQINYLANVEEDKLRAHSNKLKELAREHGELHLEGEDGDHDCLGFWMNIDKMVEVGNKIADRMKLYRRIFWAIAEIDFPELNDERESYIRENFQLVWVEVKPMMGVADILGEELASLISNLPTRKKVRES